MGKFKRKVRRQAISNLDINIYQPQRSSESESRLAAAIMSEVHPPLSNSVDAFELRALEHEAGHLPPLAPPAVLSDPAINKSSILLHTLSHIPSETSIPHQSGNNSLTDPLNTQFLHPVDSGVNAWLFLLGATVIEILIWGIPFSIGVLHLYWTTVLFPGYGAGTLTLAATMHAGLSYVFTAIFGP